MSYKILIIGGGGVFGYIPILFLKKVGLKNINDLQTIQAISGTSIGGIIALYLASNNNSIDDLHKDFKKEVGNIFASPSFFRKMNPCSSKYPNEQIENSLKKMIPNKLGDIKIPLFVGTMSFKQNKPKIFDTVSEQDKNIDAWIPGRCTSAAPTYFNPYGEEIYLDYGICENIPILTTVTAIKNKLGISYSDMEVFVLGTGWKRTDEQTLKDVSSYGAVSWLRKLILPRITMGNELSSDYWARQLGLKSYTYFNPVEIDGDMDDADLVIDGDLDKACEPWLDIFEAEWNRFKNGILDKDICSKNERIISPNSPLVKMYNGYK